MSWVLAWVMLSWHMLFFLLAPTATRHQALGTRGKTKGKGKKGRGKGE